MDNNRVGVSTTSGSPIVNQEADYADWHVANIYYGESDGFLSIDGGNPLSFGISGKYASSKLLNVQFGGTAITTRHVADNYIGEVLIFDSKLTDAERETVTAGLVEKWGIGTSASCDASGAISNGAPGSACSSTLADGATCSPTCNSGYTLSGQRSCSAGTLTDTAVCNPCLLYTSPSPRDQRGSRMPSSA